MLAWCDACKGLVLASYTVLVQYPNGEEKKEKWCPLCIAKLIAKTVLKKEVR